jgi:hypothetical protein
MVSRTIRLPVAALCACLLAPAAAEGADPVRPVEATGPIGNERLSDERSLTRLSNARAYGPIHRHPDEGAPAVGRLRRWTEDGFREVYVALRAHRDESGRLWVKVRIPARPNGRRGWVPRSSLGPLRRVTTRLVVNRRRMRATLFRGGRRVWSSRIGVGAASTPTPAGRFWIRSKLRGMGGVYGPYAFGTAAYSVLSEWPGGGVVGIHGTDRPGLLPGRVSHGCIRVPNAAIRRLARKMPIGTPVRIV